MTLDQKQELYDFAIGMGFGLLESSPTHILAVDMVTSNFVVFRYSKKLVGYEFPKQTVKFFEDQKTAKQYFDRLEISNG